MIGSSVKIVLLVMFTGCFSAFDAPYPRGDMAPSKDFPCPAVVWNNTYDGLEKVNLEHALVWHAAENIKLGHIAVSTPCGDSELSCATVKSHIEHLDGRVIRSETCAVVWQPHSSWYASDWNWRH